jgi:hypothetical protein
MRLRLRVLALALLLPTCTTEEAKNVSTAPSEKARAALGTNPPSEIATWTRVAGNTVPDPRVGQAVAYDSARKVVIVFGGAAAMSGEAQTPRRDLWEWNPATSAWRDRSSTASAPGARSEAAAVYDSARDRFILFGGRAQDGSNFQDTWEWNPSDGAWTLKAATSPMPEPRARHSMVYDEKRKVVVLFGGGRTVQGATGSSDAAAITVALSSTWEYEPVSATWTSRTPAGAAPSARYDAGLVWDSQRNVVVLFGGMQKTDASVNGSPKQDIWEWNGETGSWTERTLAGNRPSARFGHGMAYDPGRGKVVVFGGYDINTGETRNDLWDWEPATGTWSERAAATATVPSARIWASLVLLTGSIPPRMELLDGSTTADSMSSSAAVSLLSDVWELDSSAATWTSRLNETTGPAPRSGHAMATDLDTGKVYLFGGDYRQAPKDDLWVWDGTVWTPCKASGTSPPARSEAGMAYDPVRKSLIVFGGTDWSHSSQTGAAASLGDTWEWNIAAATWTEVKTAVAPPSRMSAVMVTDSKRGRIVLVGGADWGHVPSWMNSPDSQTPVLSEVWEWNGADSTWTNVAPPVGKPGPQMLSVATAVWDTGREKLVAIDNYSSSQLFEWDPYARGWLAGPSSLDPAPSSMAAFDSVRRRMVALGSDSSTLELETATGEWFSRVEPAALQHRTGTALAFDNKRAVVVLFGGYVDTSAPASDTWEYKVTGLGNGAGCSVAFASRCASGNCVDGVCCGAASCAGVCQACNVAGTLGICTAVAPGTEVAGSCVSPTACDGLAQCKAADGSTCSSPSDCASGFCSEGVCCDSACTGTCRSCKLPGRIGTCSPFQAGSDPEKECGVGSGICQSTCDGLGKCAFPTAFCGRCGRCDGAGTCAEGYYDPHCDGTGGAAGGTGGGGIGGGGSGGRGGAGGGGSGGSGSGGRGGSSGGGGSGSGGGFGDGGFTVSVDADGTAGSEGGRSGSGGAAALDADTSGIAGAGGTAGPGGSDGGALDTPGTDHPTGGGLDGGLVHDARGSLDGGGASFDGRGGSDVKTGVATANRGCTCALGKTSPSPSGSLLLLGAIALLVRRTARRRR